MDEFDYCVTNFKGYVAGPFVYVWEAEREVKRYKEERYREEGVYYTGNLCIVKVLINCDPYYHETKEEL